MTIWDCYPHVKNRLPYWFMRQAGRVMPQYRALKAQVPSFWDFFDHPKMVVDISVEPIEYLNCDAIVIFSDILLPLEAISQLRLSLISGSTLLPALSWDRKMSSLEDFKDKTKLQQSRFGSVLSALEKIKALYPTKERIGFAGAPWTLLAYLWSESLPLSTERLQSLLEEKTLEEQRVWKKTVIEGIVSVLELQAQAGATQLMLFDSWSGMLNQEQKEFWIRESLEDIAQAIKKSYPNLPLIYYSRSQGSWLEQGQKLQIDILACDLSCRLNILSSQYLLQAGIDPQWVYLPFAQKEEVIKDWIFSFESPMILNMSEGLKPDMPLQSLEEIAYIFRVYSEQWVEKWKSRQGF